MAKLKYYDEATGTWKELTSSGEGGSGLTPEVKAALLNCFAHVSWADENGQTYYNALENALSGGE